MKNDKELKLELELININIKMKLELAKAKAPKKVVKPKAKRVAIIDTDIKVGNKFVLPNGEKIAIIRLFTEKYGKDDEAWVEYNRSGGSGSQQGKNEGTVKTLRKFLNNWKAIPKKQDVTKGLVKLPAKRFHQAQDFIYQDVDKYKFYIVDTVGELVEIKNRYFLEEIGKVYKPKAELKVKSAKKYTSDTVSDAYNHVKHQQEYGYFVQLEDNRVWSGNAVDREEAIQKALDKYTYVDKEKKAKKDKKPRLIKNPEVKASQTASIKEVLALPKYSDLGEMEAGFLFKWYKDDDALEWLDIDSMGGKLAEKIEEKEYLGFEDDRYFLTDEGKAFCKAVEKRLETRKLLKQGSDLFPEHAGVPEYVHKYKNGAKIKRRNK